MRKPKPYAVPIGLKKFNSSSRLEGKNRIKTHLKGVNFSKCYRIELPDPLFTGRYYMPLRPPGGCGRGQTPPKKKKTLSLRYTPIHREPSSYIPESVKKLSDYYLSRVKRKLTGTVRFLRFKEDPFNSSCFSFS